MLRLEGEFMETLRSEVADEAALAPTEAGDFLAWFEGLRETGPGQGDPLFPWLASHASKEELRWFFAQEAAGEAGFDDLVAMTQVKMPVQAKLKLARTSWDAMGRGNRKGMNGHMLTLLAEDLGVPTRI